MSLRGVLLVLALIINGFMFAVTLGLLALMLLAPRPGQASLISVILPVLVYGFFFFSVARTARRR
jgi:hypothetical protein